VARKAGEGVIAFLLPEILVRKILLKNFLSKIQNSKIKFPILKKSKKKN